MIYKEPNKHTKQLMYKINDDHLLITGYQSFKLFKDRVEVVDKKKSVKYKSVFDEFGKLFENKTVVDLGSANGLYVFGALQHKAKHVTAVEMDSDYTSFLNFLKSHTKLKEYDVKEGNVTEFVGRGDIVLALALVHWIYSCTALFGSLNSILERLKYMTREHLIIEFVDENDPILKDFGHLHFNPDTHKEAYSLENFIKAAETHFLSIKQIPSDRPTRYMYLLSYPIYYGYMSKVTVYPEMVDKILINSLGKGFLVDKREVDSLNLLSKYNIAPKLLGYSNGMIRMENCGDLLTKDNLPSDAFSQISNIAKVLKKERINHNDIRPNNLMVKDGVIKLIDWQWATRDGEDRDSFPKKLGRGFRKSDTDFDDLYSLERSITYITSRTAYYGIL